MRKYAYALTVCIIVIILQMVVIYFLWDVERRVAGTTPGLKTYGEHPELGDNFISASGTWKSDTKLAFPKQKSEIRFLKEQNLCIESRATLASFVGLDPGETYLRLDLFLYDIESWNENEVIAKDFNAEGVIRVDRKKQMVTLTDYGDKQPVLCYLE